MNQKPLTIITLITLAPVWLYAPSGRTERLESPESRVNSEIRRVDGRKEQLFDEMDTARARLSDLERNFDRARQAELRAKMKQSLPSLSEMKEFIQLGAQEGRVNQATARITQIQQRLDNMDVEIRSLYELRTQVIAYPRTYGVGQLPFEKAQGLVDGFVKSTKKLTALTQDIVTSINGILSQGAAYARETIRYINYKLNASEQTVLDSMGFEIRNFLEKDERLDQFREAYIYFKMREVIEDGYGISEYQISRQTFSAKTFKEIKDQFDKNELLLLARPLTPEQEVYRDTYFLFEAMRQQVSGEVTQFAPLDLEGYASLTKIVDPYYGKTLGWLDGTTGDILAPRGVNYSPRDNMLLMVRFLRLVSKRNTMDLDFKEIVPTAFQDASLTFLDTTAPALTDQLDRYASILSTIRATYSDLRTQ
ncbi:hypothetical protein JW872_02155 [Candidatus Babeliales bacterium]|nr:hypothetical protein [Candidatus Babeliales bacterium]